MWVFDLRTEREVQYGNRGGTRERETKEVQPAQADVWTSVSSEHLATRDEAKDSERKASRRRRICLEGADKWEPLWEDLKVDGFLIVSQRGGIDWMVRWQTDFNREKGLGGEWKRKTKVRHKREKRKGKGVYNMGNGPERNPQWLVRVK